MVCNIPHTFLYEAEPGAADAVAELQNAAIGALCRQYPDRFSGLATVACSPPPRVRARPTRSARARDSTGRSRPRRSR